MAVTNTPTTLASRLKTQYPDGITSLVPKSTVLVDRIKFRKDIVPGDKVRFDVQLNHELGFSVGTGELTLNAAVAQETAKAEVEGYQIVLRSRVSYDLISRAKTDKQAFARFNDSKFVPMVESFRKREETLAAQGRAGLGVVLSNTSGALVITIGSWCPTLWLGMKGATLEAFTALTGGSQHNTDLVISAIDINSRTITVTGTSAAVAANDILFFKGHRGVEPVGLMAIAKNTSTLYNIDASTQPLWAANAYDVGTSGLTLAKIMEASGLSAAKGCDEPLTALVPITCFQNLAADEAALRQYGGNYSPDNGVNGFSKLTFHGATGPIEVLPYHYMKNGEFVMFPERYTDFIGSSEMTNELAKDGDMIFDIEASTAKEMRLYAEWTVFCERPGYITYGTRSDGGVL